MGVSDLIAILRKSGFTLSVHDDRLQITPAEKLSEELKRAIRQSKAAILAALKREILPATEAGYFMWELETRSRGAFTLSTWPPSTLAEVMRDFPDAVRAEPLNK